MHFFFLEVVNQKTDSRRPIYMQSDLNLSRTTQPSRKPILNEILGIKRDYSSAKLPYLNLKATTHFGIDFDQRPSHQSRKLFSDYILLDKMNILEELSKLHMNTSPRVSTSCDVTTCVYRYNPCTSWWKTNRQYVVIKHYILLKQNTCQYPVSKVVSLKEYSYLIL